MVQPSNRTGLWASLVLTVAGLGIQMIWPSEQWLGYILLGMAVIAFVATGISYWRDCHSPLNVVGISPPRLSRVQKVNILLGGAEILKLADETEKLGLGDVWITEVLTPKENAWLRDIGKWLDARAYLKTEVLASVFVPLGSSPYDAFRARISTRITRINSIPDNEIGP